MDIALTTPTADPRPFLRHMTLARTWCEATGRRTTEAQILRVMRRWTATELTQRLADAKAGLGMDR